MKHHHHTDTAFVFHHDHDWRDYNYLNHRELEPECTDPVCPSLTPRKLVRPGYRTAVRAGRK